MREPGRTLAAAARRADFGVMNMKPAHAGPAPITEGARALPGTLQAPPSLEPDAASVPEAASDRDPLATLSVVIPAFDVAAAIGAVLEVVAAEGRGAEVIVSDGGSNDGTAAIARGAGARVIEAPLGRGKQLAAGARAAGRGWLLFLHADTRLGPGWGEAAARFMADPANAARAAAFRFALDDGRRAARRLERIVALRNRWLGLPYGDQGLLIRREFYDRLGGFRPLPLMEDVDLVRRIGRRGLTMLDVEALTSASRYRRGYLRRIARNTLCLALYFSGLPPRWIARLYG